MNKLVTILVATVLTIMPSMAQVNGYRDALRLYEKGVLSRSEIMFDKLAENTGKSDPAGYSVLCDVRAQVPGYENRMDAFIADYPYSVLVPQIRFCHALNLFDAEKYIKAQQQFALLSEKDLYKSQRGEFVFKSAYAMLEVGDVDAACEGFVDVEGRPYSDYTAPSRYALGYIEYTKSNFKKALEWFEKAGQDDRFKEVASYYVLECKFLLKDYDYVKENGLAMFEKAPADRKPHLARIISESYLVGDEVQKAHAFYEHTLQADSSENTRADWFFRGSLLFAVKDYKGAIENFMQMGERKDSIGQIANYNLGYSYIQVKDKVSAMNAFKEASVLTYDKAMAEDAMFNYAKLAYDNNKDISVFKEYLNKYSAKDKSDMIYGYMAVGELMSRNYEAAVEAFDMIDELDEDMRLNFTKANLLRANQLIKSGSYRKAIPCLKAAAYYSDKRSPFNQLVRFWLAEAFYRDGRYSQARGLFTELYNISALHGSQESYLIPYNIGYCYFKEENYTQAKKWFDHYLLGDKVMYRKESLLRKADCDFVNMDYAAAALSYDQVIKNYFDVNDIYPYYQSALAYGLLDNVERKVELLANVKEASVDAEFYPEALFELGRTYAVREEDDNAYQCFNKLAETVKDSTFVAKAYIEMGSLARNQSMFNEALGYYKMVVEQMPYSEYSDDALLAIESIYQTKNNPQEYIAYIESIGKGGLKTEDEREAMIFNSAEQVYLSDNYQKALTALQSYIDTYKQGNYVYKADFYMAESYRALGDYEQACDRYKRVIDGGEGSFVELSMLNFARLSYHLEKWEDAFSGYMSLYESAVLPNNTYVAILGLMRSAYKAHDWENAIKWSQSALAEARTEENVKREADYIMAKSYLASSKREEAFEILQRISADKEDAYGAEAAYLLVMDSYDRGDFDDVENKVYAFVDSRSSQIYWRAKCFIVLGDSFAERDDMEQAKATFESIRDAYEPVSDDDDVLANVEFRLKKIEELASEGN